MVECRGLARKRYWVAVIQLLGVVRLAELRDEVAGSGFGLIRQVVTRHDVAHRRHGTCPGVERLLQTVTIRVEQVVEFRLLVRCGANVTCNIFVTVGDTLLLLHVFHEYVDAHLPSGDEEVPRLPEHFVERMPSRGILVTDFAGRDAVERVDKLGEVVGFAVDRM
jgi:hypothetical protein